MVDELPQERILTNRASSDSKTSETRPGSKSRWSWAARFVDGSGIDFSEEINSVLAVRIKLASLIFFFAYLAFFLKDLITGSSQINEADPLLRWAHIVAMAASGLVAWRLCAGCSHFNRNLRISELIVFGASQFFFIVLTYSVLISSASEGSLYPPVAPWLILIFTYALLIPNSWQRALTMMIPMAIAPVATIWIASWVSPTIDKVMSTGKFQTVLLEAAMEMILTLTIATWGVKTIRSLRTAAFEARQLGHYKLRRLLGKGGMGEVHLAEHMLLKRPCAIKLIRPEMAGNPETLSRFEREVRSTAKLTHWNTIEIYDFGMSEDGTFYYVMEYLPGMNLDQLVVKHGPLSSERVVFLLKQICEALSEAHGHGLVHRDIKPANIFAAKRGDVYDVVKLLDFGLVRTEQVEVDTKLTQEGRIAGSPLFMAPEQASGDNTDARSDIYSLGCVAYYLLSGEPPFTAENPVKLILAHAHETPQPLTEIKPDLPSDLAAIVMKCLEKDPDDRFDSVDELHDALEMTAANNGWNRRMARDWWETYGCPKKQEFDDCILEGRTLPGAVNEESNEFAETQLVGKV